LIQAILGLISRSVLSRTIPVAWRARVSLGGVKPAYGKPYQHRSRRLKRFDQQNQVVDDECIVEFELFVEARFILTAEII
jgi:hypothetical protein